MGKKRRMNGEGLERSLIFSFVEECDIQAPNK